jgi:hypothetical protein
VHRVRDDRDLLLRHAPTLADRVGGSLDDLRGRWRLLPGARHGHPERLAARLGDRELVRGHRTCAGNAGNEATADGADE